MANISDDKIQISITLPREIANWAENEASKVFKKRAAFISEIVIEASLLTVLVNVACGLWWIPRLGAVGASLASTVAYTAGATAMVLRFRAVSGLAWPTLLLPSWRDFR